MIRRARASITLDARAVEVYGLLTEYERYSDWLPGVVDSRTLAREGDITVVEISLADRSLTLEAIASPPHGVEFSTVDEPRRRALAGGWQLTPDASGKSVTLEARLRQHTRLLDLRARRRMRHTLEAALMAARQQVARVIRQVPPTGVMRRKILEVVRHGDGFRVWIEGARYELSGSGKGSDS